MGASYKSALQHASDPRPGRSATRVRREGKPFSGRSEQMPPWPFGVIQSVENCFGIGSNRDRRALRGTAASEIYRSHVPGRAVAKAWRRAAPGPTVLAATEQALCGVSSQTRQTPKASCKTSNKKPGWKSLCRLGVQRPVAQLMWRGFFLLEETT